MAEFAYKLPENNTEIATKLVGSIPDDWSWLNGQLDAPLRAVVSGDVAEAGYVIDSMSHFGQFKVQTLLDRAGMEDPTNGLILMERRERIAKLLSGMFLPSYIKFERAAFDCGAHGLVSMHAVKLIASDYINRSYVGDLEFVSDCYDDYGSKNPARIELHMAKWREWFPRPEAARKLEYIDGQPVFDTPRVNHPPLVKLSYIEEFNGRKEHIDPTLTMCEELGLEVLDPSDIGPGSSYSKQM